MRSLAVPFQNVTVRQTIPATIGGEYFRLRVSNKFGSTQLPITNVSVALPTFENGYFLGSKSIDPDTLRTVTFSDSEWVIVPDGALAVSDPFTFGYPLNASQAITISMYFCEGHETEAVTVHDTSKVLAWFNWGEHTQAPSMDGASRPHWYFISAIEAWQEPEHSAFVVVGDSISDGAGSVMNDPHTWPDYLFERMQQEPSTSRISVLNQGIAGNEILYDGHGYKGTSNRASRIERDVLGQSGIKYVMLWEGINDIGRTPPDEESQRKTEERLKLYYKQIVTRLHTFGIAVFGSTITPFLCPIEGHPDRNPYASEPSKEQTRLRLNEWIRNSSPFDAVVDFDAVMRDPANFTQQISDVHKGDCLHPSDKGRRRLAEHFPLDIFESVKYGVDTFR